MDGSDAPSRPKLTIVTVCKDIAGEIAETCESIVSQTFQDVEWIVVDGASTDGTLEVLEKYRQRIGTLISEPDRGIYHAMNKGIALARGEYLLFLNAGDYLVNETVLERVFSPNPDADILYGNELFLHDDGFMEPRRTPPAEEMGRLFFSYCILNHQVMFIKRKLFEQFGYYEEQYPIAADRERWIVFSGKGCAFAKLDFAVSVYRLNGGSCQERFIRLHNEVVERIRAAHFTDEELRAGLAICKRLAQYRKIYRWGAVGRFSIFSINETPDGRKRKYLFMNIPLLKIDVRGNKRILGFIKI